MMEFELDTKSWHFWLANFGTRRVREWRDDNDLCSYIRAVFWGSLLFCFTAALCLGFAAITANMLYEIYMIYAYDAVFTEWGKAAFMLYTIVTLLFGLLVLAWFTHEKAIPAAGTAWRKVMYGKHKEDRPPTFLALTYRKFKEKTCFKIKFKQYKEE